MDDKQKFIDKLEEENRDYRKRFTQLIDIRLEPKEEQKVIAASTKKKEEN